MENASKALLIAAAVLIAIVLIAVGVSLLNSSSDVTEQSEAVSQSTSAQSFNAQFIAYEGQQKGSVVRNLFITITTSNDSNPTYKLKVTPFTRMFSMRNKVINEDNWTNDIDDSKTYTIKFTYDDEGYIKSYLVYTPK